MKTIHAVFENGVFRPTEQVELPEHSQVEFEPRVVKAAESHPDGLDEIYEILGRSYDTGERDVASRHNEHQP